MRLSCHDGSKWLVDTTSIQNRCVYEMNGKALRKHSLHWKIAASIDFIEAVHEWKRNVPHY